MRVCSEFLRFNHREQVDIGLLSLSIRVPAFLVKRFNHTEAFLNKGSYLFKHFTGMHWNKCLADLRFLVNI